MSELTPDQPPTAYDLLEVERTALTGAALALLRHGTFLLPDPETAERIDADGPAFMEYEVPVDAFAVLPFERLHLVLEVAEDDPANPLFTITASRGVYMPGAPQAQENTHELRRGFDTQWVTFQYEPAFDCPVVIEEAGERIVQFDEEGRAIRRIIPETGREISRDMTSIPPMTRDELLQISAVLQQIAAPDIMEG